MNKIYQNNFFQNFSALFSSLIKEKNVSIDSIVKTALFTTGSETKRARSYSMLALGLGIGITASYFILRTLLQRTAILEKRDFSLESNFTIPSIRRENVLKEKGIQAVVKPGAILQLLRVTEQKRHPVSNHPVI